MEIVKERQGDSLTLRLSGRLDTGTSPELQEVVTKELDGVKHLAVDMAELEYITSAGLRVLLNAAKKIDAAEGSMVVKNANEDIREVFKITGFDDILVLE